MFLLRLSSSIASAFNSSSVMPSVLTPSGSGRALTFSTAVTRFFLGALPAAFFPLDEVEAVGEGATLSCSAEAEAEAEATGSEAESNPDDGDVKNDAGRAAGA